MEKSVKSFIFIYWILLNVAGISSALAQTSLTPYPSSMIIQGQTFNSGTHLFSYPGKIVSPANPNFPVIIDNTANVIFQSADEILLKEGFEASFSAVSGTGQFLGKINPNLDMVLITPVPSTAIVNGQVHVPKWEKLEIAMKLPVEYQAAIDSFFAHYWNNQINPATDLNPYAFDSLEVRFDLVKPDGTTQLTRWAFFMRPGMFADTSDSAYPVADTSSALKDFPFRFRFAPDQLSNGVPWTFIITIRNPQGLAGFPTYTYQGFEFICDQPLSDNHGYLEVNAANNKNLKFEDGTPFFAIGLNMADVRKGYIPNGTSFNWLEFQQRDFHLFNQAIDQLSEVGGNFIRTWLYKYTFAPEWEHLGVYDAFTNSVNACPDNSGWDFGRSGNRQWSCWLFDSFLEKCKEKNMYMMLCVNPSVPVPSGQKRYWGDYSYVREYVYPTGIDINSDGIKDGPYHAEEFFVSSGVNDPANEGAIYYWKRKYKYVMSRWGYSTNIGVIETFSEINGTLAYDDQHAEWSINDNNKYPSNFGGPGHHMCDNNQVFYEEDAVIQSTIRTWHDIMLPYVQDELDDNKHLFTVSYGKLYDDITKNDLFDHPLIDINDTHHYYEESDAVEHSFNDIQTVLGEGKPAILGEYSAFGNVYLPGNGTTNTITYKYYNNYDVSLHNEMWSSAMSGSFGIGLSWFWENIFWWPDAMPYSFEYNNTIDFVDNGLGESNPVTVGGFQYSFINSTSYHQYKTLSDFFQNIDITQTFTSKKYTDAQNGIQAIYNIPLSVGYSGYGWVHNYSRYWQNSWVIDGTNNFFEDSTICTNSSTEDFVLEGLIAGETYNVSFYATRMGTQILPSNFNGTAVTCGGDGCLNIDMNFTLGCDTTNSDFAFIIICTSCSPIQRLRENNYSGLSLVQQESYGIFPIPSNKKISIKCPLNASYYCTVLDSQGKHVKDFNFAGDHYQLEHSDLLPGFYLLQINSKTEVVYKKLVIE